MARVVAFINQKGGVGKTTTAIQIGSLLKYLGKKVLMIDMDPQCNLSYFSKGNLSGYSILDAMLSNAYAKDIIQVTKYYDLIVSNGNLASYSMRFKGEKKEYRFKEVIEPLKEMYDYILIDCPPTLGDISIGILTASDSMVIPVNCDIFSIEGLKQICLTYDAVKQFTNPRLRVDGVLLTRCVDEYDSSLYKKFESMTDALNIRLFKTKIHESPIVRGASVVRLPIWAYCRTKEKVLIDYVSFLKELMNVWKGV